MAIARYYRVDPCGRLPSVSNVLKINPLVHVGGVGRLAFSRLREMVLDFTRKGVIGTEHPPRLLVNVIENGNGICQAGNVIPIHGNGMEYWAHLGYY